MDQGQSSAMNYGSNPYQTNPMTTTAPTGQDHAAYHQIHQQQQQQLTEQLQSCWVTQFKEIEQTTDFKNHSLPLARIKKIMKADEDVRMISAEAPVVFARACEMFILELTLRSWNHTEENKRRTLQKNDIAAAVTRTDIFDFLVDIVPREDLRDEVLGGVSGDAATAAGYPYGYLPPGTAPIGNPGMLMDNPGMLMGNPGMVMDNPGAYPPNPGMVMGNPGMLMGNPGMLMGNPGMVMDNPGMVMDDPGMVMDNPGAYPPNPGMVMGNPGAYPPNPYMGQPMWQQHGADQQDPDH